MKSFVALTIVLAIPLFLPGKVLWEADWLIGNPTKAIVRNDRVFIADYQQKCIFVVSPHGKKIMQIGREGQGPGEIVELTDFTVGDGKLYVLNNSTALEVFDLDGRHYKKIRFNGFGLHTVSWACRVILTGGAIDGRKSGTLFTLDAQDRVIPLAVSPYPETDKMDPFEKLYFLAALSPSGYGDFLYLGHPLHWGILEIDTNKMSSREIIGGGMNDFLPLSLRKAQTKRDDHTNTTVSGLLRITRVRIFRENDTLTVSMRAEDRVSDTNRNILLVYRRENQGWRETKRRQIHPDWRILACSGDVLYLFDEENSVFRAEKL